MPTKKKKKVTGRTKPRPRGTLNPKQEMFCVEYLIDLNASQAAIRAGYSVKAAKEIGCKLLTKANVQAKVEELKKLRSERVEITADRVLAELGKLGFSNFQDFVKKGFTFTDIVELEREKAACIESVTVKKTRGETWDSEEVKFKLHDKLSALDKIGRHLGMWNDKLSIETSPDISLNLSPPQKGE